MLHLTINFSGRKSLKIFQILFAFAIFLLSLQSLISFGIKTLENCWLTGRQIEAARQAVVRYMKREGKIWIRIFPDKPYTKKPAEVRMGKGKGNPEGFVCPVTPGRILIEAEGVPMEIAKEALRLGAQKLPVTTKFVVRRDYVE